MDFVDVLRGVGFALDVADNIRQKKYEDEFFKILIEQIDNKVLYIDSNIFMAKPNKFMDRLFNEFRMEEKIKIKMPTEQYEEIYTLKNSNDETKAKYARDAFRRIEELVDSGNLNLPELSDRPMSNSYADPAFIKAIIEDIKNGQKVFFITEDKDLKIRLKSKMEQENIDDNSIIICSFESMLQDKNKIVDEEREREKERIKKEKEANEMFEKIEKGTITERLVENTLVKWLK